MNKKSFQLWLSIVTVAVAIGTLYLLFTTLETMNSNISHKKELLEREKKSTDLPTKNQVSPESVNTDSGKPLSGNTVNPIEGQSATVKNNTDETPDHVKADIEIRKKWLISRGYTNFIDNDEYKSYSKDTLEKLSNSGDIRAMDRLAKMLEKTGDSEKAKSIYKKAAVYGSTSALGDLSTWAATESMAAELVANDSKAAKAYVIESMAYLKAASLRGDNLHYSTDMM
jgi:hypothetical protein